MKTEVRYPDFVIGGAPKCGTTSLFFWLASHPQTCASKVKEPHFLLDAIWPENEKANFKTHGIEAYSQFFKHCEADKLAFESTAQYLYHQNAREQLLGLPTKPKVIFLLREPSAQIYSHYLMMRYRTQNAVMPLREYLKLPFVLEYVEYAKYLKPWLESWPKNRIKVLLFEDLMKNKTERMQEVADFLGVGTEFYTHFNFEHRNETVAIRQRWLHQLGLKLQPMVPHLLQRALLPLYLKMNSKGTPPKPEDELQIIAELKERYKNQQIQLAALLPGLPVHLWN